MERYLLINPETLQGTCKALGDNFFVEISPYDVPRGVMGKFAPANGGFTVAFEYIDDEPATITRTSNGVIVHQGKHSGKVLKLIIPVGAGSHGNPPGFAMRANAMHAIGNAVGHGRSCTMNHRVARRIVADRFADLATGLVPGYARASE